MMKDANLLNYDTLTSNALATQVGYFDDATVKPSYDPGRETTCPVCGVSLGIATPLVTISFMVERLQSRSYFFRAHRCCWDENHERAVFVEGAIVDAASASAAPS